MRAVGLTDLDAATRAVVLMPPANWVKAARAMMDAAHVADIWRKRTGRPHPSGGTGSLYVQATLHPVAAASLADPRYCAAMAAVLLALSDWRLRVHQAT